MIVSPWKTWIKQLYSYELLLQCFYEVLGEFECNNNSNSLHLYSAFLSTQSTLHCGGGGGGLYIVGEGGGAPLFHYNIFICV